MMKKYILPLLIAALALTSCMKPAIPTFADTKSLASAIYEEADLDMDSVYTEDFQKTSAFAFGISAGDYENAVKNGIMLRPTVDDDGEALYVFETKSGADARRLAEKISRSYEWAPCDNAEKMAIVCAEEYLMLFKSESDEVESAVSAFRRLSGGKLAYRKDLVNHA